MEQSGFSTRTQVRKKSTPQVIICFTNCFPPAGECEVTLNGHKSAVTTLALDGSSLRLASGARDANVIVWDLVNECGLFRLKGHKGPVTKCQFLRDRNVLVTSSKDTLVKFWDLDIQHCFNTIGAHMTEVWDFVTVKKDK